MDLGLAGKGAVVLASTRGLGFAAARALAREGAKVALSGRDPARLQAAVKDLHGDCWGDTLDVTQGDALRAHLETAKERFGSVDILVTNAGGPTAASALDIDDAGLARSFDLTLRSAIHAAQAVLPWMRARGWGRIIGLTSISVRQPIATLAYSNIMRSGLTAYFKSLASEVARDGVLVNTVCTGYFATQRLDELLRDCPRSERDAILAAIPQGRMGEPPEFGDLIAFLASERCSYMTGAAIPYDGGANRALL